MPFRIMVVFGTRPEAIKLCVLIRRLQSLPREFRVRTVISGQHRSMLDQVLAAFQVTPDYDLAVMRPGQSLTGTASRILARLEPVLERERPQLVIVQGDTTTAAAAAWAAFYHHIFVAHVEAGLRSGDVSSPYPEEMNRVLTDRLSDLHFAATEKAAANLRRELVAPEKVFVTGNTGIDAIREVCQGIREGRLPRPSWRFPARGRRLLLVTTHRRESFGAGLTQVCRGLLSLARRKDVEIVCPVHRNPAVADTVRALLGHHPRIHLLPPLEYTAFIDLMERSYFILTDSGGIQEEAPWLGKPVLVLRPNTERPEAVEAGAARLVGVHPETIVREAHRLLDDAAAYRQMTQHGSLYGDGHACEKITEALMEFARRATPRKKAAAAERSDAQFSRNEIGLRGASGR